MDDKKKDRLVQLIQFATVVIYILLVLKSTVGRYIKLVHKNMEREAKRKDKLNKAKYIKKKRELKARKDKKS
ncbi:MAG: hypothetical protein ACI4R6_04215 [Lachnospiraceae bacterium]